MALYSPGPYSRNSPRDGGLTRCVGLLHAAPRLLLRTGKEAVSSTGGLGGNPAPTLSLSDLKVAVGGAVRL